MPKWTELVFGVTITTEDSYSALDWIWMCPQKETSPDGGVFHIEKFWLARCCLCSFKFQSAF